MNKLTKIVHTTAGVALLGVGTSLPAGAAQVTPPDEVIIMAGSSTQSRNGLTCHNEWFNTLGRTNCTGNSTQKWRLKLTCQFQGDIYGEEQSGPGSDQNECTVRVTGASISWS